MLTLRKPFPLLRLVLPLWVFAHPSCALCPAIQGVCRQNAAPCGPSRPIAGSGLSKRIAPLEEPLMESLVGSMLLVFASLHVA